MHVTPNYVSYLCNSPGSLLVPTSPLINNIHRQCYSFISKKQAISNSIHKSITVLLYLPGGKNKWIKRSTDITLNNGVVWEIISVLLKKKKKTKRFWITLGQLFSYAFPTNERILTFSSFVSCCIFRFISSYSPYIFFLTFSRVALTWCHKNQMPFSNLLMILFIVGLNWFFLHPSSLLSINNNLLLRIRQKLTSQDLST